MKIKIILFILFFGLLTNFLLSQDTSAVKYFPLKTGNIWVYKWYHHMYPGIDVYGKTKKKITASVSLYNKTYFVFSIQSSIPGYMYCGSGSFDTLRIDSITGNIYRLDSHGGCSYSPDEECIDSLRADIGDTIYIYCGNDSYVCADTNKVSIYGTERKSMKFVYDVFEHYISRRYIKGIGPDSLIDYYGTNICNYYLQGCVIDGVVYGDTTMPVGIIPISAEIPLDYDLFQNYPNPFNPSTKIRFDVPHVEAKDELYVKLSVYDVTGKEIEVIVEENLKPGVYEDEWNASGYPSGVYLCRMSAEGYSKTVKMVILK